METSRAAGLRRRIKAVFASTAVSPATINADHARSSTTLTTVKRESGPSPYTTAAEVMTHSGQSQQVSVEAHNKLEIASFPVGAEVRTPL